jgi:Leucine-rich repeat (LRR) protein
MKKFLLFSLAISLNGSSTVFAINTILGKRNKSKTCINDKLIKIRMTDSQSNLISSLPIEIEAAKLSTFFAEQLQILEDEEDAKKKIIVIPTNVISLATLKQIIDLMSIYNKIKKANDQNSDHEIIRELYDAIRENNSTKNNLINLLEATNYLHIDLLEKVLGLVVFDQYKWQWHKEPVRPNISPYTRRQLSALKRAINPHTRGVPLTPKKLTEYGVIPDSFNNIKELKNYLNHPIGKTFSHHSNEAMVRFVRDYIEQAHAANSLPELPVLIKKFQAQPLTPLYIALFIEYYLQTNAQGIIFTKLPHASTLSTVARRICDFKDNADDAYDDGNCLLCLSFIGADQLNSILRPLCEIIESLCQKPITKVDLGNNELSEIPAELDNLTNLIWLDLGHNKLASIPAWINNLKNLGLLDLCNNKLTEMPAGLGNLTNLTWLDLGSNQLASVSAELGNLINLTELALSSNQLTSVPAGLVNLINLTELYLEYNQLTEIPANLGNLTNLTRLNLRENHLTGVPASLNREGLEVIKDSNVVFEAE